MSSNYGCYQKNIISNPNLLFLKFLSMGSWENAACVGNSNSRQLGPHLANLWVEIERITEEWEKKKKAITCP